MNARFLRRDLHFIRPAVTSRGSLTLKETYFIELTDPGRPGVVGIGECALFRGLGADDRPGYAEKVAELCDSINRGLPLPDLSEWSSIRFGLEMALASLAVGGNGMVYPSDWTSGNEPGITINGLVWMDSPDRMEAAAMAKAESGFHCIKFKIGACDFRAELRMIERLRRRFGPDRVEIRLDANGAWRDDSEALRHLRDLAPLDIHSLEQPVKARQEELMQAVVANSPVDIALDEELIGRDPTREASELLSFIRPAYIILKPSLCGGFSGAEQWIDAAMTLGIGHWATSALESNVGLNAIAQWTARNGIPSMPQGLGTGALYLDNLSAGLRLDGEMLHCVPAGPWESPFVK
jgi:o-succinylbenzoate synthase